MDFASASLKSGYTSLRQRLSAYSQRVTDSLEISKPKNHIPVMDGIRAIACLGVLSYHANFLARNYDIWRPIGGFNDFIASAAYFGESGVILFFLLSGFLLFLPFAKALLFDGKWPSIMRFYLRRCFRILPGYYAALFLLILFFHSEFLSHTHRSALLQFLTFRMNSSLSQEVNGPFWTLAIEFQFYMLLPLFAWIFGLIARRGTVQWRMFKLTICLLLMIGWGMFSRYWALTLVNTSTLDFLIPHHIAVALIPYIYSDTGKYFESFAIGMLIAMIYIYTQNASQGEQWRQKLRRWSPWLFMLGLAVLGFLSVWHFYVINISPDGTKKYYHVLAFLDQHMKLIQITWEEWQAIGYSLCYGLCIFALLFASNRLKRPFEWPFLRWIGLISFSLYMWHLPFIFLYVNHIRPQLEWMGRFALYCGLIAWIIIIIFPVSLTLYRWVEMPGMRLGEMLIRKIEGLKKGAPSRATTGTIETGYAHVSTQTSTRTTAQTRVSTKVHLLPILPETPNPSAEQSQTTLSTWPCGHMNQADATQCSTCHSSAYN